MRRWIALGWAISILLIATVAASDPEAVRAPCGRPNKPPCPTTTTPTPTTTTTTTPGPIGNPTPLPPNTNTTAGQTIINPIIDCNIDITTTSGGASGLLIDDSNVTIINPSIRECWNGIFVSGNPTNVRIIADDDYVGYAQTNITRGGTGIMWVAGNGEIGDVSVPDTQVGGAFKLMENREQFHGRLTTSLRLHHLTVDCVECPLHLNRPPSMPGPMWGIKFLSFRPNGVPFEASNVRIDHNDVDGFQEEGIGFDCRCNTPASQAHTVAGTVSAVSPANDTVTLTGLVGSTGENLLNQWVTFNEGPSQGRSVRVTQTGTTLTVDDPNDYLSGVSVGTRIVVGMRYTNNRIDHNIVDTEGALHGIDFWGTNHFSRIDNNTVVGTGDAPPAQTFIHYRTTTTQQCIHIASLAGPGAVPSFSTNNSMVGNTCTGNTDISAHVVSYGTYEVDSPTWMSGNVLAPGFQEWRYKAPQPAVDPTAALGG